MYLVQRSWSELSGVVRSRNNRIEGRVEWGSEEQILGATRSLLRSSPKKRPGTENRRQFLPNAPRPDVRNLCAGPGATPKTAGDLAFFDLRNGRRPNRTKR